MPLTGVHSGRFGVIDGITGVRSWNISESNTNPAFKSSATKNGTGRSDGIHSWNGSYNAFGRIPFAMPGEFISFAGYTAPDNDTLAGVGTVYEGSAIIDSVVMNWNFATNELLSHVVNFSGDGALTATDADTALADATAPAVYPPSAGKVEFSAAGSTYTVLTNITQATLTISAANQSAVNSSSASGTVRTPGDIDWTMALTQEKVTRAAASDILIKSNYYFKLFTDATDFWLLKWGKVRDYSGIEINRETGAIIKRTINIDMSGFVGGVAGSITKPGAGSAWWPV